MATSWPTSVQTFSTVSSGDSLNSPSHSGLHNDVSDTVEALQEHAGLVLVKTQTVGSGVSSVTVTGAFSSTFDNYHVTYYGGIGSGGTIRLDMNMGGQTGNHYYAYQYMYYTTGSTGAANGGPGNKINNVGEITSNYSNLSCWIYEPAQSRPTTVTWQAGFQTVYMHGAGRFASYSPVTSFEISPSSGTISGGTIRVYGYNNG